MTDSTATELAYRQQEAARRLAKPMAQVKVAMKAVSIAAADHLPVLLLPDGWAWRAWWRHRVPPGK